MKIITDGLFVFTENWGVVLGILFIFLLGVGITFSFLSLLFKVSRKSDNQNEEPEKPSSAETFSLSLSGGMIALFLGLLPIVLLNLLIKVEPIFFVLLLACLFVLLLYEGKGAVKTAQRAGIPLLALGLILVISITIRLAFLSKLILPPYFDSAAHYQIVKNIITSYKTSTLPTFQSLAGGYYHLGFHVLVAAMSFALRANPGKVILVLGQIILASLPLPLYFLVRRATASEPAAFLTVLLAGWGWSMPAYAVNWGKYPAIASLLPLEFVLCIAYLTVQAPKSRKWALLTLCGLGIGAATFVHSRALILVGFVCISGLSATGWQRLPKRVRGIVFCLAAGGLALVVAQVESQPVLNPAFGPYIKDGLWTMVIVLLLMPFALKRFSRVVFASLVLAALLFGGLFVPVALPGYAGQTLLDRPFVEIILYLPLSILGGLGFAGLLESLRDKVTVIHPKWLKEVSAFLVGGLILVVALGHYDFYPSPCCQLFGTEDAVAFDWLAQHPQPKAKFAIASTVMYVSTSSPRQSDAGADAGIWLGPLLGVETESLPYGSDLSAPGTFTRLCRDGVTDIYVGGMPQSFNAQQIRSRPTWYTRLLSFPSAQIYKITGCAP